MTLASQTSAEVRSVVASINNERRAEGLPTLVVNDTLEQKARAWAEKIAGGACGRHDNGNPKACASDLQEGNPRGWIRAAENVGSATPRTNVDAVVDKFLDSPGHHANIVNRRMNTVGVAIAYTPSSVFVVQEFVQRRDRDDSDPDETPTTTPRTTPSSTSPPRTTPSSTSPPRTTPPATNPPATTPPTTPPTGSSAVKVTCTRSIAAGSSISSGVSGLAAGDTLCLRGGVYSQTVNISRSGSSGAPIVIASQPGETAVIDGAGASLGSTGSVVNVTGSYVTLANLEVRNSSGRGITIAGAGDRVSGTRVHNIQYNGILASGSNQLIDNNEVWNTVLSNTNSRLGSSGWAEAVNTWRASNTTIRDNYIHDNWGEGIDFIASNGGTATGNRVFDSFSVLIYVDGSSNITISNNQLGTTTSKYDRSRPPHAVLVASEGGGGVSNITVTNNTLNRTGGIGTWNISASALRASNNTGS